MIRDLLSDQNDSTANWVVQNIGLKRDRTNAKFPSGFRLRRAAISDENTGVLVFAIINSSKLTAKVKYRKLLMQALWSSIFNNKQRLELCTNQIPNLVLLRMKNADNCMLLIKLVLHKIKWNINLWMKFLFFVNVFLSCTLMRLYKTKFLSIYIRRW